MKYMKALFIAITFVAAVYFAGIISSGDKAVQLATVILFGFALVWYGVRAICCACTRTDKSSCKKLRSDN